MSETTVREQLASLAKDHRAWIPFAVIGVLLLLLSTVLIVSLETREDPEPEVDEQLAFDRGEASAQAALRDAVRDAATEAGDAPVTSVDSLDEDDEDDAIALRDVGKQELFDEDASQWCELAPWCDEDDGDESAWCTVSPWCDSDEEPEFDELPKPVQQNHIFENYVRLLIFEHASERFEGTGQEIRGTETDISLQEAEDLEEKIKRVNLTIGHQQDNDLEPGMLGVSIEDVDLRVTQDGETIDERTLDHLNGTVGTTLFELHNRTQEYEMLLNKGFFQGVADGDGFGRAFGLRLYPMAYAKSGVKYLKPTMFDEIASNRQSEILANHATYSVQEQAFGVSDPHSSTEMRIETVCLGLDIIEEQLPDPSDIGDGDGAIQETLNDTLGEIISNPDIREEIADTAADELDDGVDDGTDSIVDYVCEALRDSYGDEADGDISDLPKLSDLLGGFDTDDDVVNEKPNVSINTSAALAYLEITESSIEKPEEGDDNFDEDLDDWELWQQELDLENMTTVVDNVTAGLEDLNESEDEEVADELEDERDDILKEFYKEVEEDDFDASPDIVEVIADVYAVDIDNNDYVDGDEDLADVGPPGPPAGTGWHQTGESTDYDIQDTDATVTALYAEETPAQEEMFYEVDVEIEQEKTITREWGCNDPVNNSCSGTDETSNSGESWAETTITLEGEYAPGIDVEHADERKLEHAYTDGGDVNPYPGGTFDGTNFDGIPEGILNHVFEGSDVSDRSPDELEQKAEDLEAELDELDDALADSDDLVTAVTVQEPSNTYCAINFNHYEDYDCQMIPEADGDASVLGNWLEEELAGMIFGVESTDRETFHEEIGPPGGYPEDSLLNRSNEPNVGQIQVDIEEFLEDDELGLLEPLQDEVGENKTVIVYQDIPDGIDSDYDNAPDLARAELYHQFTENLNASIETQDRVRQRHADQGLFASTWDSVTSALGFAAETVEKKLSEIFGDVLNFADEALESGLDDGGEEEGELDSPLFEDVTFEIHGSPTYLSGASGAETREDTAAVRPGGEGRFANASDEFFADDDIEMPSPEGTDYATMYAAYANAPPYPGLPIIPAIHVVQASMWNVEVGGEYPRFEVSATTGDPASTTSYVRENATVEREIGDKELTLGEVEPINFQSRTFLGVLMPPGGGVGDGGPSNWTSPSALVNTLAGCMDTYPELGADFQDLDNIYKLLPDPIDDWAENVTDKIEEEINEPFPLVDPIPVDEIENQAGCIGAQFHGLVSGILPNGDDDE